MLSEATTPRPPVTKTPPPVAPQPHSPRPRPRARASPAQQSRGALPTAPRPMGLPTPSPVPKKPTFHTASTHQPVKTPHFCQNSPKTPTFHAKCPAKPQSACENSSYSSPPNEKSHFSSPKQRKPIQGSTPHAPPPPRTPSNLPHMFPSLRAARKNVPTRRLPRAPPQPACPSTRVRTPPVCAPFNPRPPPKALIAWRLTLRPYTSHLRPTPHAARPVRPPHFYANQPAFRSPCAAITSIPPHFPRSASTHHVRTPSHRPKPLRFAQNQHPQLPALSRSPNPRSKNFSK